MAKEKEAKQATSAKTSAATRHQTTQHGTVACICNGCGETVEVPTSRLYAKAAPAVPAQGEKTIPALVDPDTKEVLKPARKIPARPFIPRRPLQHRDISGGTCDGTFRTVNQHKPKTHKSSKQRHGNNS